MFINETDDRPTTSRGKKLKGYGGGQPYGYVFILLMSRSSQDHLGVKNS